MNINIPQLKYLFIIVFSGFAAVAFAQQPVQYSMYYFNPYPVMPAAVGMDNSLQATAVFRKQWLGLEGSPTSFNLNAHLPWQYAHGGVGVKISTDAQGAEQNTFATANYAYHVNTSETSKLSFGLGLGMMQKKIRGSVLRPANQDVADAYIPQGDQTVTAPVIESGIYYKNKNLKIGAAVIQYSFSNLRYKNTQPVAQDININLWQNYYLTAAYNIPITDNISIEPSLLVKADKAQLQTDASAVVHINKSVFVAVAARGYNSTSIDAASVAAGTQITPQLSVAYNYDIGISNLKPAHNGSHEVILYYNLGKTIGGAKKQKIIYNTRFW